MFIEKGKLVHLVEMPFGKTLTYKIVFACLALFAEFQKTSEF